MAQSKAGAPITVESRPRVKERKSVATRAVVRATSPVRTVPRRLRSVDALRGAAALLVVLLHAAYVPAPEAGPFFEGLLALLRQGHIGVALFFVISGFCIDLGRARRIAEGAPEPVDFVSFWKRRFRRLYPPYVFALCFSMILLTVGYLLAKDTPLLRLYPEPKPLWMGADFLSHLLMLHQFIPLFDWGGGNPVFWSLAREEIFYLLYFALLAWRRAWNWLAILGSIAVGSIVFRLFVDGAITDSSVTISVIDRSFIVLWIQWCLGMVAAEACCGLITLPKWCSSGWLIPVWMVLAKGSELFCPALEPVLWGMTFFTLLNWCVGLELKGRWPENRLTKWLSHVGVFSYSLYLVHSPVRRLIKQALGHYADTQNPLVYLLIVSFMVVCGYGAGRLFFHFVESRFLNPSEPAVEK